MKIIASLFLSGGLLLLMATPVNAHQSGHYGYDRPGRQHVVHERRRDMPRWLKRKDAFRHWYRRSQYKRHYAISWARVYEIYRWERRYGYRQDSRRYRDRRVDRRVNRDYEYDRRRRRGH